MTRPGDMLKMPVEKAPFHSMSRTYLLDSWYNTCKKLQQHLLYVPPRTVCIDEGLVRYNGKCKLKVYEPSKPGCYGIKMYLLCDTDKHYTY